VEYLKVFVVVIPLSSTLCSGGRRVCYSMAFVSGLKIRNRESFQKKKWNRETWAMLFLLFLGKMVVGFAVLLQLD
jgi:hypothetical protein